ncbi:MAG: hypothetical protein IKZ24_00120, partial [Burkholderiaceae bacterium]|nr:hypothetical protein [Burkholderiaceae bacterium]
MEQKKTIGIIAGFDFDVANALKEQLLAQAEEGVEVLMTEDAFACDCEDPTFQLSDRKIFVFNETELLAEMGADLVLVPDAEAAAFLKEV